MSDDHGLACRRGDEQAVARLLAQGHHPDGPPGVNRRPLSEALYGALPNEHGDRDVVRRLVARLLQAGADPRLGTHTLNFRGTPLAFAWRVLCDQRLCDMLLDYGARLFTDEITSMGIAIRDYSSTVLPSDGSPINPQQPHPELLALNRHLIRRLPQPNERYAWGRLLEPFLFFSDAGNDAVSIVRELITAGADPTLIWNTTLIGKGPTEEVKECYLRALALLLDALSQEEVTQYWPSGMCLSDAWESADGCSSRMSLSKGWELILRAASANGRWQRMGMGHRDHGEERWIIQLCAPITGLNPRSSTWGTIIEFNQRFMLLFQFLRNPFDDLRVCLIRRSQRPRERVAELTMPRPYWTPTVMQAITDEWAQHCTDPK